MASGMLLRRRRARGGQVCGGGWVPLLYRAPSASCAKFIPMPSRWSIALCGVGRHWRGSPPVAHAAGRRGETGAQRQSVAVAVVAACRGRKGGSSVFVPGANPKTSECWGFRIRPARHCCRTLRGMGGARRARERVHACAHTHVYTCIQIRALRESCIQIRACVNPHTSRDRPSAYQAHHVSCVMCKARADDPRACSSATGRTGEEAR